MMQTTIGVLSESEDSYARLEYTLGIISESERYHIRDCYYNYAGVINDYCGGSCPIQLVILQ